MISHRDALRNSIASLVVGLVDAGAMNAQGRIVIFDALNNIIARCPMSNPAFGAPVTGTAYANAITADNAPTVGGIPARFEVWDRDNNWVWRGSCGVGGDMGDDGTAIPAGTPLVINNFFYRAPT